MSRLFPTLVLAFPDTSTMGTNENSLVVFNHFSSTVIMFGGITWVSLCPGSRLRGRFGSFPATSLFSEL